MPEIANNEEKIIFSKWEELISQTIIVPNEDIDDEKPKYTVSIEQPQGATITVTILNTGESFTNSAEVDEGSTYTVSISGDNAKYFVLNTEGGKVEDNISIFATDFREDDDPDRCAIIILQDSAEDQIIRAHITDPDGKESSIDFRNSTWVTPGSKAEFYLEIPFQRKWDPGRLNMELLDPVVKNVNYVYATPPIVRDDYDPTIVIVTIIQVPHMTIHVWVTPPGETEATDYTSSFNAKIGSSYKITTTMESEWYEGGSVRFTMSGVFTQDCTITGISPELVMFTVHITQTEHQTITVICNGKNYTSDFTTRKGSTWMATISGESNRWDVGDITPYSSGTLTSDIWITATPATFLPQIMQINFWKMTDRSPYASFWGADDNAAADKYTDHGWFQDWWPMRTFCYRTSSENLIINMADDNKAQYLSSKTTYIIMHPWYVLNNPYDVKIATKYNEAIFKFPSSARTNFKGWEEATDGYGIDTADITMILDGTEYPPESNRLNSMAYKALKGLVYCWNNGIIQFDCDVKFDM